jgi:hypothetical protein
MLALRWPFAERLGMAVYTVHEPPNAPASRIEKAEQLLFIKDGFSWVALFFTPLWFLFKGEWRGLLGYLVLAVLLAVIVDSEAHPAAAQTLMLALSVIVGFEANNILRWSRGRRGWREIATVSGSNRDECERRFFDAWLHGADAPATAASYAEPEPDAADRIRQALDTLSRRLRQRFAPKT